MANEQLQLQCTAAVSATRVCTRLSLAGRITSARERLHSDVIPIRCKRKGRGLELQWRTAEARRILHLDRQLQSSVGPRMYTHLLRGWLAGNSPACLFIPASPRLLLVAKPLLDFLDRRRVSSVLTDVVADLDSVTT